MKFGYTIIYVNNVPETIDFYQRAFSLKLRFLHESNQYAEMETGETTLAFAAETLVENNGLQFQPNRLNKTPGAFEIAFVTKDVNLAYTTAVKAGAKPIATPNEKPWGQIVAYVTDINGVIVEICEPITP